MMRFNLYQKLISAVLAFVLVVGMAPVVASPVIAAETTTAEVSDRVADPSTMNGWEAFFGPNVLSTEFAGGVWTDKSVFTDSSAFRAEITMDDPDNNFLVALSAIAANQQITGYSTAPVDVMLVLDVSGSMLDDQKDETMVDAANNAIDTLLKQNKNNRVGVVLYSGNTDVDQLAGTNTATVILPLDHYTTTSTEGWWDPTPVYLTYSSSRVSVASGVRNSAGNYPSNNSKTVTGGTYIQNGIYKAWGEFSKVTDVKVPAGQAQAGAQRTPVMVLLSDGQPTLATTAYSNVGSSQSAYGDGQEKNTTWKTVFLSQLTAAWAKGKMAAKYGTTARFYTLGLGTGNSSYATAVLNPTSTTNGTLNGYWTNYFNNRPDNNGNVTVFGNTKVAKDSHVEEKDYVDLYKLAADTDELLEVFQSIVESIELDAAGHVTLVGSAGEDLSGYITFADELGSFIEVKSVKGLVLGSRLYTGHGLAELLEQMGTIDRPTAYGDEFIHSIRERLGLNTGTAQSLVAAAFDDGQLYYNSSDGSFSNYIGWYSDDDGVYKGFWDKDTGITADGAPQGATWINRSYIYMGDAGDSDMMYVSVRVCTHITSGMQVVQYKIPASLIPKVTYEVELDGEDQTAMTSIKRIGADPLRLVYEVGLQEGLNAINIAEKTAELPEGVYVHRQADGTYEFYTNLWGSEDGGSVDYNDPLSHEVAQSHFHPAENNDRYYYTEDTIVYSGSNGRYTAYDGRTAPTGSNYYRAWHYYTASGYTTEYLPIDANTLQTATRKTDGSWYIPQGAVFQQLDRFHMPKSENTTGTLQYYNYPVVVSQGDTYDVYAFLGNNGKFTLKPAQGIKLTKTLDEAVEGAPETFTFHVRFDSEVTPTVTDEKGNVLSDWTMEGKELTVSLKAGETVYIIELPTGLGYTVEEEQSQYYLASSTNATGTVVTNTVTPVDFVNVPRGYGNLIVSKDVDHPFVNAPAAMANKEFTIHVKLTGEGVANQTFAIAGTDTFVTTDENGIFTVVLKENGSLTVTGLPEGTGFQASETLDPETHKGFTMDESRSILTGTVVKDRTAQAHVVNIYAPTEVKSPAVNVAGNKILVDEAGAFDWTGKSFTFRLEQYDTATGQYIQLGDVQVTDGSLAYSFTLPTFSQLGSFYFKVSEVIPQDRLEGMSYDATAGRFEVIVTDDDVDGALELKVVDFDTRAEITPVDGVITYTKNFTNTHSTDATFVEFAVDKEVVDPHNTGVTGAGFLFELYETTNGMSTTPAYAMRTLLVDGKGQATFHIPTTHVGVRTFELREAEPIESEKIPGMIYDKTVYTVTVTTTAQDGKLSSVATFAKGTEAVQTPVFVNEISLEPIVLKPYVTKTLLGREPMEDDLFHFHLEQTTGSFVPGSLPGGYSDDVVVDYKALTEDGGNAYYTQIPVTTVGTYYFRSTETVGTQDGITYDAGIYHITVDITFKDGQLQKDVSYVKVGQGVPSTETDFVQFVNTYKNTDSEQIVLDGKKVLTGRDPIVGEFTFLLQGEGISQSVTNKADGSFTFAPITYTVEDVGVHTYTITEIAGNKGGITYDDTVYTVTVTVSDDGKNNLVVTTEGAADIVFENTYSYGGPVGLHLSGTKTWTNTDSGEPKAMAGGEFTFALYASNSTYTAWGYRLQEITNDANGGLALDLSFSQPGNYYYLLSEVIPEGEDRIPGASYDTGVYQIGIQVFDDGVGALHAVVSHLRQVGTGATSIVFSNTFTPAPVEVTLEGIKDLTGRTPVDGEFSFTLSDDKGVIETVQNENGTFTFAPLTFEKSGTYTYTVREEIPQDAVDNLYQGVTYDPSVLTVTVTVAEGTDGKLTAAVSVTEDGNVSPLAFQNTYTVTDYTSFSLEGEKELSGQELSAGQFAFELLDAAGVRVALVRNDAEGAFHFSNIPLTTVGEHKFTVHEVNEGKGGILYDGRTYTVTVITEDDGLGGMTVYPAIVKLGDNAAALSFQNTYRTQSTTAQIRAQKILEGLRTNVEADEFQFILADASGATLQTKGTFAGGEVVFDEITYPDPGEYTYTVREVIPAGAVNNVKDGITYDDRVCTVRVLVKDNGDGTMTADVTYQTKAEFTNTYDVTEPTTVDIYGTKTLEGKDLEAGLYSFTLWKDDEAISTVTNGKDGSFVFADVPLDSLGTHVFTVTEAQGQAGGITYDQRTFTVTVQVTDNGKGGMEAGVPQITVDGVTADLEFVNRYQVTEPTTVSFGGTKELLGIKQLTGGLFQFALYAGDTCIQTVSNQANTFTFTDVPLEHLGEHTFTVREVIPADAVDNVKDGITYDPLVYTVKVNVVDNGQGGMTAEDPQFFLGVVPVNGMTFTNRYDVKGTSVSLSGSKILVGKELQDGMFAFELLRDGQTIALTQNVGEIFTFENIPLDTLGDHVFTIRELVPDEAVNGVYNGVTYSGAEYVVDVTLRTSDDGVGGMIVSKPTYTKNGQPITEPVFENLYEVSGYAAFDLSGTKTLTGGKPLESGLFAFDMYEGDALVATAHNEEGSFTFRDVKLTALGRHTLTVTERMGDVQGVTYDERVYTVTVDVVDNGDGTMSALTPQITLDGEAVESLTFDNSFVPQDITVTIHLEKTVTDLTAGEYSPEGFCFNLSYDGEVIKTVESDADGKASFEILFNAESLHPGTFRFQVSEVDTDVTGIIYSTKVYEVTVVIGQDATGELTASVLVDDKVATEPVLTFVNVYDPPSTPITGDTSDPILMLAIFGVSALGIVVLLAVLVLNKKRKAEK